MADPALKKSKDQLNCSICLGPYTNPKVLQCCHVYCQKCLLKLLSQDQQGRNILTCPLCRQVTPVPASGVESHRTAFPTYQIVVEHKKATAATARADKAETAFNSTHKNTTNHAIGCPQHGRIEMILYCETCGEIICWKCIKKGEKHHNHEYHELNEAFERYKHEMKASLQPMKMRLLNIEKALAQLDTRHDEISDQRATIEADIHDTFTRLQQTLDARKTELISQLHQLTKTKLKSLAAQSDQLEKTQEQLSSCLLFMREKLQKGNPEEALLVKSTTLRQVKELTTSQPDMLEPTPEANIIFSAPDLSAECQNYGKVYTGSPNPSKHCATGKRVSINPAAIGKKATALSPGCQNSEKVYPLGSPDPSKCYATGKGVDTAAVGEMATAVVQIVNYNSEPCKTLTTSISCELISEITGTRASGHVEKKGKTRYKISYQPTIKGRHQLHITVEGQHIRGSPFPVSVRSPVEMLGAPILTIAGMRKPWGVAVNKKGEVVVTELERDCVTVFHPTGERLRSFGTYGFDKGQLNGPSGVAVDAEDNILVCDNGNHRIQKFTAQGEFLTAVGTEGSGPLQFNLPRGIAVSASNGRVYVSGSHGVSVLSSDLSYVGRIGEVGSGMGQLKYPQGLACDSTGNVYVVDIDNHHIIQVFTAEGGS